MSSFSLDDSGFFEMLFESRIIKVADKERIFESIVGWKEHIVDMLTGDKALLFSPNKVPSHDKVLNATYKK